VYIPGKCTSADNIIFEKKIITAGKSCFWRTITIKEGKSMNGLDPSAQNALVLPW
jgi:hypothetical protein